jgi:hypothetical protein
MYLLDHLQASLVNLFEVNSVSRYSKMDDDPHHAGKSAFDDESLDHILVLVGQFESGDASQRPSHDPEIFPKVSSGKLLLNLFQDDMAIVNETREGWNSTAGSITSVISNDEVEVPLMIKGRDLIIVAHHFTISVEKQDPRPLMMAHVKSARDRGLVCNKDGDVKGILRTQGEILTRIKDISEDGRLVEGRIIDHGLLRSRDSLAAMGAIIKIRSCFAATRWADPIGPSLKRGWLWPPRFIKDSAAMVAFQEALSTLDRDEGNEEKAAFHR